MDSTQRRARLVALIDKRFRGDRQAFLKKADLSKGRLTQLLDAKETFGERAARSLEKRLGLPAMWFDVTDEALPGYPTDGRLLVPITLQEEKLLMYFKLLSPAQRDVMINDAREQAYAKSITEKVKGSPVKDHVGNSAIELAYGLPRDSVKHPQGER